jgi:hypothetical protein
LEELHENAKTFWNTASNDLFFFLYIEVNDQMGTLSQDEPNKNEMQELSNLIKDTGGELAEEYYSKVQTLLNKLHLFDCDNDSPSPLEVWEGVAQAIADYSGYRVVLEAAILEPTTEDPNCFIVIGHRQNCHG